MRDKERSETTQSNWLQSQWNEGKREMEKEAGKRGNSVRERESHESIINATAKN